MKKLVLAALLIAPLTGCNCSGEKNIHTWCDPAHSEDMDCRPGHPGMCRSVDGAVGAACEKGCLMNQCEDLRKCETASADVEWCGTSCEDIKGGLYWQNVFTAADKCIADRAPDHWDCVFSHVETLCPALAGTGWRAAHLGLK